MSQHAGARRPVEARVLIDAYLVADLSSVVGFDDAGARLLANDLARARSQRMELAIQRPEKLVAALERKFGRKLYAQVAVDPSLIGGVSVKVGDEVLDTSVRARLAAMQTALTAA